MPAPKQIGPAPRSPIACLLAMLAAMALGLASRRYAWLFPPFLGKYPGDALWTLMVFFGCAAWLRTIAAGRVAALALAISWAVEFLKLWQAPWLVEVRHTTVGHLVFGHVFSWQNLVAYAVGAALGWGLLSRRGRVGMQVAEGDA